MKLSYEWIKQYLPEMNLSPNEVAELLTSLGLEVDSCAAVATDFTKVVVGKIIAVEPHPDADRLQLCSVDIGENDPLAIVCGAANARADINVAVALVGANLGNNFKIKKSKIRGQLSYGMLCSEQELGLAKKSSGILELPNNSPLGKCLREYLDLNDYVIDIDLTPNRGDCASVLGICRELAAALQQQLQQPEITALNTTSSTKIELGIEQPELAPVFSAQVIEGLDLSFPLPILWQQRLLRSGLRSVNPLVDILNLVMLESGVPMHAYDLSSLKGKLQVGYAIAGEEITLLDGKTYTLNANDIVVRDQNQAQSLAGIMGAQSSEVVATTSSVVLEAAYFPPLTIAKSARQHNIHSEASYRFERGVDSRAQEMALQLATSMLTIYQAENNININISDRSIMLSEANLPRVAPIKLRERQIKRILGLSLSPEWIDQALSSLGMKLQEVSTDDSNSDSITKVWLVEVPSWRFDLNAEYDLMQELLRCHGYQNLPEVTLNWPQQISAPQPFSSATRHGMRLFADLGYHQIISYAFVSAERNQLLAPALNYKEIANPLAKDQAAMRTSLWPGLLSALQYNLDRQQKKIALFEIGACFSVEKSGRLQQQQNFAAVLYGPVAPEHWSGSETTVDFYDLKSAAERWLSLYIPSQSLKISAAMFTATDHPALHPGQCAAINYDGQQIGFIGKLDPRCAESLGIKSQYADIFLFEMNLDTLPAPQVTVYQAASRFPAMRRDLSLLSPKDLSTASLLRAIEDMAEQELSEIKLTIMPFDVYIENNVNGAQKSIALHLTFQATSRTLIEEEINKFIQHVVDNLQGNMGLQLRG